MPLTTSLSTSPVSMISRRWLPPLFENIRLSANGVCIKLITSSGTFLNGIRQIIAVNLPLGLLRHRRQ
jgi:hypothetical protein